MALENVNVDKEKKKWLKAIKHQKQIVAEQDKVINVAMVLKTSAEDEIAKYARFIETAKEMFGGDLTEIPEQTREPSKRNLKGLKLSQAIRSIFRQEPQRNFTGKGVTEELRERGFISESPNFRTIVYNTLQRMVKQGGISVDRQAYEHYYKHKEKNESESFLK